MSTLDRTTGAYIGAHELAAVMRLAESILSNYSLL